MRTRRTGRGHGRTRILTRRTAGILGIAGLSVTATFGFAGAGMADTSSPGASGDVSKPTANAKTEASVILGGGPESVKSDHTATYPVTLKVSDGPLKDATVTPGGSWHGGTIKWSGCESVDGAACDLGDVSLRKTVILTYSAPKVTKNTPVTLTVRAKGKAHNDELTTPAKSRKVLVNKASSPTPTKSPTPTTSPTKSPTKTAKPTPTKTSGKPSPTKSHQGHSGSHKPSHKPGHKPSKAPRSTPTDHGNVPFPTNVPGGGPSNEPQVPNGSQKPWTPPSNVPTDTPTLPSVAPSPEGSPRNPNVAEPPHKASGQVHTDVVSVPAAAVAAFVGIGAGTLITRAVRRRGLWHPIGRHRE